jgi:hypothetical protein
MAMVNQSVYYGTGEFLIVEYPIPFAELKVRCDYYAVPLISFRNHLKQELRSFPV